MIPRDSKRCGINRRVSLSLTYHTAVGFFILLIRLVFPELGLFDLTSDSMSEADERQLLCLTKTEYFPLIRYSRSPKESLKQVYLKNRTHRIIVP